MASSDTTSKTFIVAFLLCLVCSVIVSTAAVMLKPTQKISKELDFKRNMLVAAHMLTDGQSVDEAFSVVDTHLVDIATGKYVTADQVDFISSVANYDQFKAKKYADQSISLGDKDLAKISKQEKISKVWTVENNGQIEKVILPVRGYGLWSTLYGFIALEADLNTVVGLVFYTHGETPGLGGEVDNPRWKALWTGKEIYAADGSVKIEVIKGLVSDSTPDPIHKVDGLSGATLTSKGVSNLVQFWLGDDGFAPYLKNLKAGEA